MTAVLLLTGCRSTEQGHGDSVDQLAFDDATPSDEVLPESAAGLPTTTTQAPTTATTTAAQPVPMGSAGRPFVVLQSESRTRAVRTQTGIVLPVLGDRGETWMVMTACENIGYVSKSSTSPIDRAHIVLDPGHGGTEVGAVGPQGTVEKTLNLSVALEAERLLSDLGAEVVLTRSSDHNLTTGFRGLLTKTIDPALLVSIHHNGGAPRSGSQPGTIVLTKGQNADAHRFGGLFFDELNSVVHGAAEERRQAHAEYMAKLDEYEGHVNAYDLSVQVRDTALLANGSITQTTIPAVAPDPVDGMVFPRERHPVATTTLPPAIVPQPAEPDADGTESGDKPTSDTATARTQTASTVAVPDTISVPAPFTDEPVREFLFAGGGNRGVRSWVRADGKDYLSVLRHSADVPAVLAEFLYVTNPSEEELLMDPDFIAAEAAALADAIVAYFSTEAEGSGFVEDQHDDQPIGGGGRRANCIEPEYGR